MTTHPLDRQYVITALRSASLRSQLLANEIDVIAIAVATSVVSPEAALLLVRDLGALDLIAQDDAEFDAMDALEPVP